MGGAFVPLTGVGLGEHITTLLAVGHRFPLHLGTATSVFVVAITVLTAALTHAFFLFQENIGRLWNLVAVMVLAVRVGGQIAPGLARKVFRVSFEKSPGYPVSVGGVHDGPAGILKGCEKSRLGGSTGLGGQLLLFFLGSIELRISCFDQFVRRMLSCHLSQPNRDRNRGEITPV